MGWAIGEQMTTDLVLAALNMAITQRRPTEVIHHSDQGSQYTATAFTSRLETRIASLAARLRELGTEVSSLRLAGSSAESTAKRHEQIQAAVWQVHAESFTI